MDENRYKAITGLKAVEDELGDLKLKDEEDNWFVYYPQKSVSETSSPSPTPTAEPTPTATQTPSPTPTPAPSPTPKTGDRAEFERTGDKVTARLIFEETASPAENDIMLIIAYKENGALKRAEMPTITDMTASFVIPEKYKDCEITVYVWDKNMKPLMSAQSVH